MLQPEISILIPVFNAEPWLRQCVASALSQTLRPAEVLVWNDGSTDGSAGILADFGSRIRVVGTEKIGGNPARNRLLQAARGEWVQFLDADDGLFPDKIERQFAETASPSDVDVIYSPLVEEFWDGTQRLVSKTTTVIETNRDPYEQWFLWQLSQTNGSIWRREAAVRIGGWNEAQDCCQDNELYSRALQAGLRFAFAPSARSFYRTWGDHTVSRSDPVRVFRERTRLINQMIEWLRGSGLLHRRHLRAAGQSCFAIARSWAVQDLAVATEYYATQDRLGVMYPHGPAAPLSYRACLRLLGFERTERLAQKRRQGVRPVGNPVGGPSLPESSATEQCRQFHIRS